jgi:hypothetical protein
MENMLTVTPDLSSNIIHTIYLTFAHNDVLFAYLVGLVIAVVMALKRPSRFATLLILGFAVLAFSFEYDKHIIVGLRDQTIGSLITEKPHFKVQKFTDELISEIMPIVFYIGGWAIIFTALIVKNKRE